MHIHRTIESYLCTMDIQEIIAKAYQYFPENWWCLGVEEDFHYIDRNEDSRLGYIHGVMDALNIKANLCQEIDKYLKNK